MFRKKRENPDREIPIAVEIGKDVSRRFSEIHIGTYASSTAFFFFLSFIPILIIALRLMPHLGLTADVIIHFIKGVTPEISHDLIDTIGRETLRVSHKVLPFSLIILIWAASQGTIALMYGLNRVYNMKEHRNYIQICVISIGYTLAMLLLFAVLIYLIFGNTVIGYMSNLIPDLTIAGPKKTASQCILFLIVGTFVFSLVYTFIPAGRRSLVKQLPGSLFSAAAWLIFSFVFRLYVSGANRYTSFYGSIGTVAILLFWLYCCFYILLLGGFINRYYNEKIRRVIIHE